MNGRRKNIKNCERKNQIKISTRRRKKSIKKYLIPQVPRKEFILYMLDRTRERFNALMLCQINGAKN